MTRKEIEAALDAGKKVHWMNVAYEVSKDNIGYYILYVYNGNMWRMTDGAWKRENMNSFFLGA